MMEIDPNDTEFTEEELEKVIQSLLSNKSPWMDGVTYDIIKILEPTFRDFFLRLYNACLNTGKVPTSWSTSVIIPMIKPGKPSLNPDNYRPISLTSSFIRILEHMIKNKIESVFDKTLINEQVGFRKRRRTMDAIVTLENDVKTAIGSKSCVAAVFFDLSSAFDSIPWEVIMTKVSDSVKGKMLRLIYVLLQTEKAYVQSCDKFSNHFRFNRGVQQEGVLSPMLFNLCMSDFPLDNIKGKIFVDDIAVWATDSSPHGAYIKIKKAVEDAAKWSLEKKLQFSSKTVGVIFSQYRSQQQNSLTIHVDNLIVPFFNQTKYLGVLLDSSFNMNNHVENIV